MTLHLRIGVAVTILFLILIPAVLAQSPPAWTPGTAYSVGSLVTYNGSTYRCLQAHTAEIGWEPATTPALWQLVTVKGGGSCTAVPAAPAGLAAAGTTSSGTTLSWSAVTAPANCTISGYTVYENGSSIGSASGKTFTVSGLNPSTAYQFTVAAIDAVGTSAQSAAVKVTTSASSGGGSGNCAPAWSASTVYTSGMTASIGGTNYKANWWTEGQSPLNNSGAAGSGQPWTVVGVCAVCTVIPTVPTNLASSGTTGYSTVLTWTAASVPPNCTISNYTILQNGKAVGTTTGTSYTAFGLSPLTSYVFAVEATDLAGASSPSATVSVTTTSAPAGGGRSFAPYIDMSITSDEDLVAIQSQSGIKLFTLAFILSNGTCAAGWGGVGTLTTDTLANGTSMQTVIQNVRAAGADVIISFGGAAGTELAQACATVASLQAAYQAVIDRYNVRMLDFDVEGAAVDDQASITRRHQALVNLKAANPGLQISYTLPVLPTGLVSSGVNILTTAKAAGLNPDVVNVMAMDYGASVDNGGQMGLDATQAAAATYQQIVAAGLTSTVGVIPMIGVNDTAGETFTLADAQTLLSFALSNSYVTRLSMWSVGRDNGSCANTNWASSTCSGLAQSAYQFSSIFESFR